MSSIKRFQEQYDIALRNRAIKDFIKENDRSPSVAQIFELEREYRIRYPEIETIGFAGYESQKPLFTSESSSSLENQNRRAFSEDLDVIDLKAADLVDLLEDSYRGFSVTTNRCTKLLSQIEARLNNLILLHSGADVFLYGIEEDFSTQEFVNMEYTTASVEPGYVTLGKEGVDIVNLDKAAVRVSASADKGILSSRAMSSLASLKGKDGRHWEYYVYTSYKTGRVNVVVEVDFDEPEGRYVGDVVVSGYPPNANSKMYATLLYSLDGQTYSITDPAERLFTSGENCFSVGRDGVKKIQILLSKNAADEYGTSGKNIYMFNLDTIDIGSNTYRRRPKSVFYAGPYEVYDENQNPVNFSIATLAHNTCCLTPEKTSVSFYLSKDNQNWKPASYTGDSLEVVQFNNTNPVGTYEYIDENVGKRNLVTSVPGNVDLEFGKEACCNLFISDEWADKFVLSNTWVERNLPQKGVELYGTNSGWFFDPGTQQYSCSIYIDQLEGVYIDLGNTSAYINGTLTSGTISLPQGYHKFETSYTNWYDVPSGIDNVSDLEEADAAYPKNHKLMIEGYDYPSEFSGARVYNGIGSYFGALLSYVTPERFNSSELDDDLAVYTIEEYDGSLYFKVKILSTDASFEKEEIGIKYMLRLDDTNTLYVKAVLMSQDPGVSPHINSYSVRVV